MPGKKLKVTSINNLTDEREEKTIENIPFYCLREGLDYKKLMRNLKENKQLVITSGCVKTTIFEWC